MAEVTSIRKLTTERVVTKIGEKLKEEKITPSSPLGVFDSGVGGLTVLSEIMRQLPSEDVIYLADTARVPYGGRSAQEIIHINYQVINCLIEQGAKMVIMACGTSSAVAYPIVKDRYRLEIVGLLGPGSRAAVAATRLGIIGIIATTTTVASGAFQSEIQKLKKEAKVIAAACPLFVPLIEGGFLEVEETKRVAKEYLKPLLRQKIDTLLLGCTHYPHLAKILREITGPELALVDPAEAVAAEAKRILKEAGTLRTKALRPEYQYLVTGSVVQFQDLGSRLLGKPIVGAKQITL